MASLARCLKTAGKAVPNPERLTADAARYQARGMDERAAAEQAIDDALAELDGEYEAVAGQVRAAGGEAPVRSERQRPTSIANEPVEAERAEKGQPARDPVDTVSNPATVEDARRRMAENPRLRDATVQRLLSGGEVTTADMGVLLVAKRELETEREEAGEQSIDESLSQDERDAARKRWDEAEARIAEINFAADRSGTETARALQFRQAMLAKDFTVEYAERKAAVLKGKPLEPAERDALRARYADAEARIKAADQRVQESEQRLKEAERLVASGQSAKKLVEEMQAALKPEKGKTVLERLKAAADESRAALAKSRGQFRSGVDPTDFLHLARIGAYHVANGAVKFADWVSRMKADLGEKLFAEHEASMQEIHEASVVAAGPAKDADAAYQKRRANQIARELEKIADRVAKRDFAKRERVPKELNAANTRAHFLLAEARAEFARLQYEDEVRNRPPLGRMFGKVQEAQNLARAVQTSIDLSGLLRQGGAVSFAHMLRLIVKHPISASRALPQMLNAFRSAEAAFDAELQLKNRPNARLYRKYGLELSESGPSAKLSKVEEQFMSRWLDKIPTAIGGGLLRGSQRAYTTILNRLRADAFDAMYTGLVRDGRNPTKTEGEDIAEFVNIATGRGKLHRSFAGAGPLLSLFFFAPRFVISRFQYAMGYPLWKAMYHGNGRVAKLIAKEYAQYLGGIATVMALLALSMDEDENKDFFNASSTNFLKFKFGETVLDPMSGLAQVTTFGYRMATGEYTTQKGKTKDLRYPESMVDETYGSVLGRFLRTKLAPVPGAIWSWLEREDVTGAPTTGGQQALGLVTPLSVRDVLGVMTDNGMDRGPALVTLSLLGMGVQHRDEEKRAAAIAARKREDKERKTAAATD
jgi:hypothetical protein